MIISLGEEAISERNSGARLVSEGDVVKSKTALTEWVA